MKGEFKNYYGKKVQIYFDGTIKHDNRAADLRLEESYSLSNGLEGTLKQDTNSFIHLSNARTYSTNRLSIDKENVGGRSGFRGERIKKISVNKNRVLEVRLS